MECSSLRTGGSDKLVQAAVFIVGSGFMNNIFMKIFLIFLRDLKSLASHSAGIEEL